MSQISKKVETFSVGFDVAEQREKYNLDFELARQTSKHFGTTHHELLLTAESVKNNLERAVYHMDEPISNHIQAVNMLLAEEAVKSVAVVLGGDGGDEVWGGYDRYFFAQMLGPFYKDQSKLYMKFWGLKADALTRYIKKDFYNETGGRDAIGRFFNNKFFANALSSGQEMRKLDSAKKMMYVDLKTWLPDESLVRSNKMSMAVGLEQRVPLLNHLLVEFGFKVPSNYKMPVSRNIYKKIAGKNRHGKEIFIEALKDYLPDHVLNRKKWGWFSPAAKWLRGDLLGYAKEVLSPGCVSGTEEYLDFAVLNVMLEEHKQKQAWHVNTLWSAITFQLWFKGQKEK